jgi:hypothetical protein
MLEADMRALGVPIRKPTAQGLLDEIAQALGELEWLRQLIRAEEERDPDALWRGTRLARRVDDGRGTVVTTSEAGPQLSVRMRTYLELRDRYQRMVAVALAHEIDERLIEVAEQRAETLGQLVAAALDAAGVGGDDRARALAAARDRFRLIQGGAA